MRGKSASMDGYGEQPNFDQPSGFYVPGERHENLPAGGFAGHLSRSGMGTPVQSLWEDRRLPEYATGGSGMFQGIDFGHGKLVVTSRRGGYGQDDSSTSTSLSDILSSASDVASAVSDVSQAVSPAQAAAAVAARAPAAVAAPSFLSSKIGGVPVVAVIALAGVGAFFALKKKR